MSLRPGLVASSVLILLGLAACQTPTPQRPTPLTWNAALPQTQEQQWQGHFSILLGPWGAQASEGQSFTFFLQTAQQAGQATGQLDLMTPLGTQLAQVRWTPSGTHIESAQGTQHYASLQDLSTQLLGEDVPLQALPHWLQGLPSPDLPTASVLPDHTGFVQAGWIIDVHTLMVGKLQATREQTATQRHITIKVRLEH